MPTLLQSLYDDHRQIRHLLATFELELGALTAQHHQLEQLGHEVGDTGWLAQLSAAALKAPDGRGLHADILTGMAGSVLVTQLAQRILPPLRPAPHLIDGVQRAPRTSRLTAWATSRVH